MIFQGKGGGINSSQQTIKKEKYRKLTAKGGGGEIIQSLKVGLGKFKYTCGNFRKLIG